ncbi:hypothetical protein AAMO2058_001633700 [Amorphochlora amoebiformis]
MGLFSVDHLHWSNKISWAIKWIGIVLDFVIIDEFDPGRRSVARLIYYAIAAGDVLLFILVCKITVLSPLYGNPNIPFISGLALMTALTSIPSLVTSIAVTSFDGNDFITFQTVFKAVFLFKSMIFDPIYVAYKAKPEKLKKHEEEPPRFLVHVYTLFTGLWCSALMSYEMNEGSSSFGATMGICLTVLLFTWLAISTIWSVENKLDAFLSRAAETSFLAIGLLMLSDAVRFAYLEFGDTDPSSSESGARYAHLALSLISIFLYSLRIWLDDNTFRILRYLWALQWIQIIFTIAALVSHRNNDRPGDSEGDSVIISVLAFELFFNVISSFSLAMEGSTSEVYLGLQIVLDLIARPMFVIGSGVTGAYNGAPFIAFKMAYDCLSIFKSCCFFPCVESEVNALAKRKADKRRAELKAERERKEREVKAEREKKEEKDRDQNIKPVQGHPIDPNIAREDIEKAPVATLEGKVLEVSAPAADIAVL